MLYGVCRQNDYGTMMSARRLGWGIRILRISYVYPTYMLRISYVYLTYILRKRWLSSGSYYAGGDAHKLTGQALFDNFVI